MDTVYQGQTQPGPMESVPHLENEELWHFTSNCILPCGWMCSSAYCNKIPVMISLRRGKVYFVSWFDGFSLCSVGPIAFEGQHIMGKACG
jgi:hypothetical protein